MDWGLGPSRALARFHVQSSWGQWAWKWSFRQELNKRTFWILLFFAEFLPTLYMVITVKVLFSSGPPPPSFQEWNFSALFCEREAGHSRLLHPLCCCLAFLSFCSCPSLGFCILGFGNSPGGAQGWEGWPLIERLMHFNQGSSTKNLKFSVESLNFKSRS